MNKKTFTLAVIFLICALGWLGANVYWRVTRSNCVNVFDLVVGVLFVAAGVDIWYVPVIMALASAAMTVGALQHRKRKVTQNKD